LQLRKFLPVIQKAKTLELRIKVNRNSSGYLEGDLNFLRPRSSADELESRRSRLISFFIFGIDSKSSFLKKILTFIAFFNFFSWWWWWSSLALGGGRE
jgi:hypothetical protein